MFETRDEAESLNSDCAFCGKEKFKLIKIGSSYDLTRCTNAACTDHCKWGHVADPIQINLGGSDTVAIASGWV